MKSSKKAMSLVGKVLAFSSCALVLGACGTTNLATYDGGGVTKEEFYARLEADYGKTTLSSLILDEVFNEAITEDQKATLDKDAESELALQIASGGEDNFNEYLETYGITRDQYLANIRSGLLMEMIVKNSIELSDSDYKALYEAYEPEVTASHILVADEATALEVIAKLDAGGDFATLASEYSTDSTASAGGSLGSFTKGTMVEEFEDAAYSLEVGKYTTTPIQTSYGYHIIKLDAKGEKGKLADMKETLKESKVSETLNDEELLTKVIKELLEEKNVKILDEDLKDALSAYLPSEEDDTADSKESTSKESTETESEESTEDSESEESTETSSAVETTDSESTSETK